MVAVVAMVALTGCVGSLPGLGGGGGGGAQANPAQHVPSNVDAVVSVDAGVVDDENTRALLNTLFEESDAAPGDPGNVDEAVDEFQRDLNEELTTNLSVEEINAVAAFGQTPDNPQTAGETPPSEQYAGAILSVDWNREDVLDNVRESATVEETTYEGVTVYTIENETAGTTLYGAEYETGLWAFSANQQVVEDVIDVAQGNADSFGGDLRTAFDNTREDAYVRYATTVSEEQRQTIRQLAAIYGASAPVDLTQFGDVTAYAGAYYTEGEQVGVSTYMTATNESSAQRLNQTLGSLITLGKGTVEPGSTAEAQLDALSTEQDGDTLSIVYQIDVETLQELIRENADAAGSVSPALPARPPVAGVTG